MKKKRKRIRIKYKNILLLLIIVILLVLFIKYVIFFSFNHKIYDNIKGDNLLIKTNKNKIKLSKKNMEYIKESSINVKIKNNGNTYTINNNYISKETDLTLKTYSKKIREEEFNNSKGYFLDVENKINKSNITLKLPMFLKHKKYLDIYGIKDNKYYKIDTTKVKNKRVSFNINKKYKKYAVVYVKLKDILVNDISIVKKRNLNLDIKYNPENTTIENFKIDNINNNYIEINDNKISAKKSGNTSFDIIVNNKRKKVNVTIKESQFEVIKKDGIYYIDDIMLVNKSYPIRKSYDPKGLLKVTQDAYNEMREAAEKDDINLWIVSGYRSYEDQEIIYNNYVKISSKEDADTYSARPGYSEHQTGYVVDLNDATSNFDDTKEAKWLEKNCYKYGFIIRFPKGKEAYTGYKYEPWHLRYVGFEKAEKIMKSNLSLEEYYNLSSKYKD